jgi:hypothetical protein
MTEQPRRKYLGIVDDDEIARAQEIGQRADLGMRDGSAVAMEMQQPRGASVRRGLLRDQL